MDVNSEIYSTSETSPVEEDYFSGLYTPEISKQTDAQQIIELFLQNKFSGRPADIAFSMFEDSTLAATFIVYDTAVQSKISLFFRKVTQLLGFTYFKTKTVPTITVINSFPSSLKQERFFR